MRRLFITILLAGLLSPVFAQDEPVLSEAEAFAQVRDADPEVRVEAVRALQTSLDPRIPDTMLPLLRDEGNSIRRLAARAIGSRWWQIPRERVSEFVGALERNAGSEFEDEQNMVARALGLLRRDYAGKMFARSANKRWVIYERRGLPCLIDTQNSSEELLGWSEERSASIASAWGNAPVEGAALWHPKKEMVAFSILLHRKASTVWIWRHEKPLREIEMSEVTKALDLRESDLNLAGGFFTEPKEWAGEELRFEVSLVTTKKEESYVDHTAVLAWNAATDRLRVVSHQKQDG